MHDSISQELKNFPKSIQQKHRVLIVDDQWANRYLLRSLLEAFPVEVYEAENGLQAVEIHLSQRPHLIWMDICMPVMDGLKAVKLIRNVDTQTKIIVMSALDDDKQKEMMELGCDAFITKPCRVVDIYSHVHQLLPVG